ncbi:hypothetical protein [Micromonospora sp. CPCC 206061]|uniref:hypothetical protein n=1 Tax=Micromonospora sp. CPCC 206061 TaxID=3122410 RepID=UPI002FF14565
MFHAQPAPTSPAATAVVTPTPAVEVSPSVVPATGSPLPLPAEAVDGTPLLSTLVQSGAALVAIIAGLLIARLVALVGERSSLERRERELAELSVARRDEYAEIHRARLDEDGGTFIEYALDHVFAEKEPTFEKAYASYDDELKDGEELRTYYDQAVAATTLVMTEAKKAGLLDEGRRTWSNEQERDGFLQRFPDGVERRVAARIARLLEAEWETHRRKDAARTRRGSGLFGLLPNTSWELPQLDRESWSKATRGIKSAPYLQLRANESAAKQAMQDTERDRSHAREALAGVSKPEGLIVAVLLLAGIAVAGMVLPLMEMTNGETALSTTKRWIYTGLFLLSLAAFFAYLIVEIVRLNKPPRAGHDKAAARKGERVTDASVPHTS